MKSRFSRSTFLHPDLQTAFSKLAFVRILFDEPLHFGIELHTEPVGQSIHEIKNTRNEHNIDYLFLAESQLPLESRCLRAE